jgi:hypothetical protein
MIQRWPFAFGAFSVHTLLVLLATINWATGSSPEPEMRWLWLLFLDVPVSGAYLRFVSFAHGELLALTSFFFGGAQWAIVGVGFDLLRKFFVRRSALRGARNI